MSDININIEENNIEACHRLGKPDVISKSKKKIVDFVNRKNCNKIFENKKKLAQLNNEKHNFREGTKIFVSESLTPMNESISFNCRKLRHKELILCCYSRNKITNIKMTSKSQPFKIFHMERLVNCFWILILRLEKCTWMHLRILILLYIEPAEHFFHKNLLFLPFFPYDCWSISIVSAITILTTLLILI